ETVRAGIAACVRSVTLAHVAPRIDHGMVGTIDRSRISGMQCSCLLDVSDGVWPMNQAEEGLINEQERSILAEQGMELAESSKRKLLDDWFYMYLAFTLAQDYLLISYPLSDEEGKSNMPSQLVKRVDDLLPACC